jgi:hypothetical protein
MNNRAGRAGAKAEKGEKPRRGAGGDAAFFRVDEKEQAGHIVGHEPPPALQGVLNRHKDKA